MKELQEATPDYPIEPRTIDIHLIKHISTESLAVEHLFSLERFHGSLVCFGPGQSVPPHRHQHRHEIFDVIEGAGEMVLGGNTVEAKPGMLLIVPAGVEHSLVNHSTAPWVLRETVCDRVYGRAALAEIIRALRRRLRRLIGLVATN